eukprot:CAMPEP_0114534612 /NCGR_PEP_ID=MMETSP0109-20121206/27939_1 /TAXON_ID=29199 /ORGANISM="Chlorarachnion reptans, Strain CCCM449" /LENGTH=205 /DNA_ID=CAMNT_0001718049 /DNA_START=46 /DNA_END=663 /DNA_ORIENTATION=+
METFISLEPFAYRQFDSKSSSGIFIEGCSKENFVKKINSLYEELKKEKNVVLVDGYADFCKHLFIPNFTETKTSILEITPGNQSLLCTDYKARCPGELPVLTRWFPRDKMKLGKAKYLDVILYSRKQLNKEDSAENAMFVPQQDASPWGIVSIKPQNVDYELPMTPITMMRNALPSLKEGGSGVQLNKKKYEESIEFWNIHAYVQ